MEGVCGARKTMYSAQKQKHSIKKWFGIFFLVAKTYRLGLSCIYIFKCILLGDKKSTLVPSSVHYLSLLYAFNVEMYTRGVYFCIKGEMNFQRIFAFFVVTCFLKLHISSSG